MKISLTVLNKHENMFVFNQNHFQRLIKSDRKFQV